MEIFRGRGRKTWQMRFTDQGGRRRQLSTYCRDRSTALTISTKIERLVEARIRETVPDPVLLQWVAATRGEIRDRLAA